MQQTTTSADNTEARAATGADADPGASGGAMPGVQRWLEKALFAAVLAALAAGALLHPLVLPESNREVLWEMSFRLLESPNWTARWQGEFVQRELLPFLSGAVTPLPLKETAIHLIVLAALPLLLALLALRPSRRALRRDPLALSLFAFAAAAGVSLLFVVPRGEADANEVTHDWFWRGAFTTLNIFLFLGLTAMSAAVAGTARARRRMVALASIPLGLVALIAMALHFREVLHQPRWLEWLIYLPIGEDARQRMASTIGHNNGVASLSLYLWFPCLGALFLARRREARALALAGAVALAAMFLFLQTRAIWGALAVLTPPFVWLAARERGWRLRPRHVLAALALLAALIAAQSIDHPRNFLRSNPPLRVRLKQLSPAFLLESTQARIFAVTIPFMADPDRAERLWVGNGIGSFAAVYPHMQGEYFQRNDPVTTKLYIPSRARTARAHSDALQVFIEMGLLGALLLCPPLWFFARRADRVWRAAPDGDSRVWTLMIFFPLAGTLLHGLVEFPFHVAPVMGAFCVFLGMAMAAPTAAPTAARADAPPPRLNILQRTLLSPGPSGAVARTAFLTLALALYLLLGFGAHLVQLRLVSDNYIKESRSTVRTYTYSPALMNQPAGLRHLSYAHMQLAHAARLTPMDPEVAYHMAQARAMTANLCGQFHADAVARGASAEEIEFWRTLAERDCEIALEQFEVARRGGVEFFRTHAEQAGVYLILARLTDDERAVRPRMARHALHLERAIWFNPSYDIGLIELLDLFERPELPPERNDPRVGRWRLLLRRYNIELYNRRYGFGMAEAVKRGDLGEAHRALRILLYDDPDSPFFRYTEAIILQKQGRVEQALGLIERLARDERFADFELRLDFEAAIHLAAGDWERARALALEALAERPAPPLRDTARMDAIQAYTAEKLGLPDAADEVERVESIARSDTPQTLAYLDAVIDVLYFNLGELDRSLEFMIKRARVEQPAPDSNILLPLARHYFAQGKLDYARAYLREALVVQPGNPDVREFAAEMLGANSEEAAQLLSEASAERARREEEQRQRHFQRMLDLR